MVKAEPINLNLLLCLQATLIFTEAILIAQYLYQITTHLKCAFVTDDRELDLEVVGIHSRAIRALPLFLAYLATLMHTYLLAHQQVSQAISSELF